MDYAIPLKTNTEMNKQLVMRYYNSLRKTNPALSKSKAGRSMIMNEAVFMAKHIIVMW